MKFSFQEKGTGETIVLIHSYLWDSEMWRDCLLYTSPSPRDCS